MNNNQTPNTDQTLLLRASQGDQDAFGDLYEKYLEPIYRYVRYQILVTEEAEDLTETIFLKVWELLREGEIQVEIRNFRAWLYRVAHNQLVDYHRKKRPIPVDFHENPGLAGEADSNTETEVQINLDQDVLLRAIETLDQQSREVIIMRFIHGLSHTEVGEALALEPGHVRVLQHRALKKLKSFISEKDYD
ncbi:MAG: sigma-70 family RNA polymerase sigma factor [Anaerolineales bacterium]|nr:sigma-70 family RNA polymerase sigma factor [Anaerolineales bacterium]